MMRWDKKLILGITGNIAAGKSTAAKFFENKGFSVIDADKIGHNLLQKKEIIKEIVESFGRNVLTQNKIDRKKLGKIVFKSQEKLQILNKIVHPSLIKKIFHIIDNLNTNLIIIDAALLFSWQLERICKYILLISAAKNKRLERLINYKNLTYDEANYRIKVQPEIEKGKIDFNIENNLSLKIFEKTLNDVYKYIYKNDLKKLK